ncbi:hypothetical protein B2J93_8005 [Marssonina coronariae]|uniref:Uncharacterized protein n=1 Tax=Diplocarpon coronariae TaxID=2795749 RepID=A0A218ZCK3_9HELO|nr:hypothetical protein B2J93_8005 [Marssonina coronariae]
MDSDNVEVKGFLLGWIKGRIDGLESELSFLVILQSGLELDGKVFSGGVCGSYNYTSSSSTSSSASSGTFTVTKAVDGAQAEAAEEGAAAVEATGISAAPSSFPVVRAALKVPPAAWVVKLVNLCAAMTSPTDKPVVSKVKSGTVANRRNRNDKENQVLLGGGKAASSSDDLWAGPENCANLAYLLEL